MDNICLETFKKKLDLLKNTVPQDGEAKYRECNVIKNVGFFRKKRTVVKEFIGIGNYITLEQYVRILTNFLLNFYTEIDRILDYFKKRFGKEVDINFTDDFLSVNIDEEVIIYYELNSDISKSLENSNLNVIEKKIFFDLVDRYIYFRNFTIYTSKKIVIDDGISIEMKDMANSGDKILYVNLYNCASYIIFFNCKEGSISMQQYVYSSDIDIKMYLLEKNQLEKEIFINKNCISDIIKITESYDSFLQS